MSYDDRPSWDEYFMKLATEVATRTTCMRRGAVSYTHLDVYKRQTSANISGQMPPRTFEDIDPALLERVSVALREAAEKSGVASTVIDCTSGHPTMVREGGISIADIQALG